VAERERRQAEAESKDPPPVTTRTWRLGFAEIIAVLALIAAIVAWWH
jgi:ubiquinone biosynthesis protein